MTILLNGKRATSARLLTPGIGVWIADVDLDFAELPSGRVVLELGGATLSGTVDPRFSSRSGATCRVRVLGGGGGWHQAVRPQDWANDLGLLRSSVLQSTAAEVGETLVDPSLERLGKHCVRAAGLASEVLVGLSWYVDDAGITHVGKRPAATAPKTAAVLSWDPTTATLQVADDTLLRPGMSFVDDRFETVTARDVEQHFDEKGSRATVWCSAIEGSRIEAALRAAVEHWGGTKHLRAVPYRVFLTRPLDGRVELQAIEKKAGFPDSIPVDFRMGIPGAKAKLQDGAEVLVEFELGDRGRPSVRAFEPSSGPRWKPKELELDALTLLRLGETSGAVVGPGAGSPVALAEPIVTWAKAVVTALAALGQTVEPLSSPAAAKLRTS